jgi:hypothetical protein
LCLRCYEFIAQEGETDAQLDTADSLIEAAQQEETMKKMEAVQTSPPQQEDAGIPTGLGKDISGKIKGSQ